MYEYGHFSGCINMLHIMLTYSRKLQNGLGIATISERYLSRIKAKHGIFWLQSTIFNVPNAVDDIEVPDVPMNKLKEWKISGKLELQQLFGLKVDPNAKLMVFLGRLCYQKGIWYC